MNRLTTFTTAAALTALLTAPAFAETRSFDITGFDGIRATSGVDVIVEVGSGFSVELETDGDVDTALVELNGDTLTLGRQGRRGINFGRSARFTYRITMPDFESGRATAGADLVIRGIDGGDVELSSSAGADLEAEGSCDSLDAEASAGSDIRAFDLVCRDATASASSGADIELHATESIRARASSGADITVRGNPERRDVSDSSGGNVRVRS